MDIKKFEADLAAACLGQNPKQPLTVEKFAEGMTKCFGNALNLLGDVRILVQNNRVPRAISLAVLALEELGKIPYLDKTLFASQTNLSSVNWNAFWKGFYTHKPKQETIVKYGNLLRSKVDDDLIFDNPSPYKVYT